MAVPLAERIGGRLATRLICQVFEEMQSAPLVDFGDEVEQMRILAFDKLDHREKIQSIWECLDAWLEVGKNVLGRAWENA